MKRKALVFGLLLWVILSGCATEEVVMVNVQSSEDGVSQIANDRIIGKSALVEIGNYLWYDSTTGIVYWWNGIMTANSASIAPSPYYSPNGYLYRYIPETNRLEEVKTDIQ